MSEPPAERPPEGAPERNRRIPLELVRELNDAFDELMAFNGPLLPAPPEMPEDFAGSEVRPYLEDLVERQKEIERLGLDAPALTNAVWRFRQDGTELVLYHETREAPPAPGDLRKKLRGLPSGSPIPEEVTRLRPVTKTEAVITRPLAESERGWQGFTHARLAYDVDRNPPNARGTYTYVYTVRSFGVVTEGGVFIDRQAPEGARPPRIRDREPSEVSGVDTHLATEAELAALRDRARTMAAG